MFSEFNGTSKKDWLKKVNEELQTSSLNSLNWITYEGFTLEPYYTREDLKHLQYLRQLHNSFSPQEEVEPGRPRHWVNNQLITIRNEKEANSLALEALNSGANGIFFDVSRIHDLKLDILLKDIQLNYCSVSFHAGNDADILFAEYLEYARKQGIKSEELRGIFNFDPVGEIAENGLIDSDHFESFSTITAQTAQMPNFYGITINTASFHDSGATAVQEIAFGLNIAVSYLHHLTDEGMPPADAVKNLCVSMSIGTSYFMEIAKLKAIRYLFTKIAHSYGVEDFKPEDLFLHARADVWSASLLDPHVNMVRHTTQAMSAILGGCNALTVPSYHYTFASPTPFSRRLSRNISTILKEEAYFDKVADATAGSYYIETITDKLIHAAWQLFLKVEEKGGFARAFEKGFIQEEVGNVRKQKLEDVSLRRQKLVGINAYCDPDEKIPAKVSSNFPEHEKLLWPQRRGAAYEKLRLRTEAWIASGKERPQALLLMFGDAPSRRARAAFATDFLRCAGFATREATIVPQSARLPLLLQEKRTDMVVFCSSDADYIENVPEMADYIRKIFYGLVLVAARPDAMKEVKHAAIDGFINLKSNALDVLSEFQDKLFGT